MAAVPWISHGAATTPVRLSLACVALRRASLR